MGSLGRADFDIGKLLWQNWILVELEITEEQYRKVGLKFRQ